MVLTIIKKIYLVQNVEFLTGVPKDAPAFIEKFN